MSRPRTRTYPVIAAVSVVAVAVITAAPVSAALQLTEVVAGLSQPVAITHAGDGSGRLFVVERAGLIRIVDGGTLVPTPFLDLSAEVTTVGSEQGLLGLAFAPDYAASGLLYVSYTTIGGGGLLAGDSVIARYSVSAADPNVADPGSGVTVLSVPQPAANHNGGHLAFGPDGMLYLGLGDGGGGGDTYGNGQDPTTLLATILRLDVSGDDFPADPQRSYAIPADNPFVGDSNGADEVWAWGLRNPWRFSFDRCSGDLLIADVGQATWEELNLEPAGSPGGVNYGWPLCEGLHPYGGSGAVCATSADGLEPPILEYGHGQFASYACSVTGGYRYRGSHQAALAGLYVFGDFCAGYVWGATDQGGVWSFSDLLQSPADLSAFGEDESGELYLAGYSNGRLYHLEDTSGVFTDGFECGLGQWSASVGGA